jgi:N-dimethylarginine dimethylaminohydrolase
MAASFGCQSMVAPLRTVAVKRPEEAFRSARAIEEQWQQLGYLRPPDLAAAAGEHRRFVDALKAAGATPLYLPEDSRTGLDSLYAHDPVLITDAGAVILQTGKAERRGEGPAFADALKSWNLPILGYVDGPATAEAGDLVWLDARTLAAGRGFRTNQAGIDRLSDLLQPLGVRVVPVPLPYAAGPADVLHLMSFISLVDDNLAVVYRKLLPVPFFELLIEKRIDLVDVPDEEYPTLGCNVLAVAPRRVLLAEGNPVTRKRLEAAGCRVTEFAGSEICLPGSGGPTCLTRPLLRAQGPGI